MALDLGQQVGPLPLGAWAVAVAAGVGILIYNNHNKTIAAATPSIDTTGTGDGSVGGWSSTSPPSDSSSQPPAITTNEQWGIAAINWLIAEGYDAGISDSAIRKYLAVQQQTAQEWVLTKLALQHLGSPPSPLPPGPSQPPIPTPIPIDPKPKPKPVPVPTPPGKTRTFRVTKWPLPGSSLWSIAGIEYGNPSRWPDIYNANRAQIGGNPNVIHEGMILNIP